MRICVLLLLLSGEPDEDAKLIGEVRLAQKVERVVTSLWESAADEYEDPTDQGKFARDFTARHDAIMRDAKRLTNKELRIRAVGLVGLTMTEFLDAASGTKDPEVAGTFATEKAEFRKLLAPLEAKAKGASVRLDSKRRVEQYELRAWTSVGGQHTTVARLIWHTSDKVNLEREDGKRITVAIDKLSAADQEYLKAKGSKK